jgi:hypothetical protein
LITVVVYGGGPVVAGFVVRGVDSPRVSLIAGIGLIVLGPVVLALRVGPPPFVVLAIMVPIWYIGISLASDGYDSPRWSGSHFWDGLTLVAMQAISVAIAITAHRWWEHPNA